MSLMPGPADADAETPPYSDGQQGRPSKLRGWKIGALKRDLADGKESQAILGMKYGVSQQAVSDFAARHELEITAMREAAEDAYAGMWIADKRARMAVYMEGAERVQELLQDVGNGARSNKEASELIRTQQAGLRAVAEELGDLPQRVRVEGGDTPVKHVIEGVDVEGLK